MQLIQSCVDKMRELNAFIKGVEIFACIMNLNSCIIYIYIFIIKIIYNNKLDIKTSQFLF